VRLALAVILAMTSPAAARDWYSVRRDPIYNTQTCCGGHDCAPVKPEFVHRDPATGDLRITIPLEEARKIFYNRMEPFDEVIPYERIQTSEDGQVHICLQSKNRGAMQGFWCVFTPPDS
jgi:hypothetical protein